MSVSESESKSECECECEAMARRNRLALERSRSLPVSCVDTHECDFVGESEMPQKLLPMPPRIEETSKRRNLFKFGGQATKASANWLRFSSNTAAFRTRDT